MSSARRQTLSFFALGTALTAVFFWRALFSSDVFVERDILRVYEPLKAYWAQRVAALELPQWYPYDALGQPFVGLTVGGAFHPANLLYLVLSLGWAMKLNLLLCFPFAFAGAAVLARELDQPRSAQLLAATGYAFCGYAVGMTNNLPYLMGLAAAPWGIAAGLAWLTRPERRPGQLFAAAASLALIILGGDVVAFPFALAASLLGLARWQGRESAIRAAALVLATAVLSAAQWVPSLAVLGASAGGEVTFEEATLWSGHPLRLLELGLGPLFLDSAREGLVSPALAKALLSAGTPAAWAASHCLGAVPLTLALVGLAVARARRVWVAPGVLLLALWLGKNTPLFGALHAALPWLRFPEKLTPFLVLGVLLLAGEALRAPPRWLWRALAGAAFGVGALGMLELLANIYSGGVLHALWPQLPAGLAELLGKSFIHAALFGCVGLVAAALMLAVPRLERFHAGGLALIAFATLYFAHHRAYALLPQEVLAAPPPELAALLNGPVPHSRVFALPEPLTPPPRGASLPQWQALEDRASAQPAIPALWGIEGSAVYLPAYHRNLVRYRQAPRLLAPLYDTALSVQPDHGHFVIAPEPKRVPRVYLAQPLCVGSQDEAAQRLSAEVGLWGHAALVVCPPSDDAAIDPLGSARIVSYLPERVAVETEAQTPALLVLNDAWYPGWSATLDGAALPIEVANLAVRGVRVPAGKHTVQFTFVHPGRTIGLGLSALGLCAALLLMVRRRAPQLSARW